VLLEGFRFGQDVNGQKSLRPRVVILVALPTALLGAIYFLFVEYATQSQRVDPMVQRLTLRLGGLILVGLALVLAAACGYLLADRFTRPVRLILQLIESGDLPANRAFLLRKRGREIYELYRLVSVLLNQNKTGARALEELEQLRVSLIILREQVVRTGEHGVLPPVGVLPDGAVSQIGASLDAKRVQLLSFFRDLRGKVTELRSEIHSLGQEIGFEEPANPDGAPTDNPGHAAALTADPPDPPAEPCAGRETPGSGSPNAPELQTAHQSLTRLRQLGTVLILEVARVGGAEAARVETLFDRFRSGLHELEDLLAVFVREQAREADPEPGGPGVAPAGGAEGRARWGHLLSELDTLERFLEEVEVT
jgi:hypothetical protein